MTHASLPKPLRIATIVAPIVLTAFGILGLAVVYFEDVDGIRMLLPFGFLVAAVGVARRVVWGRWVGSVFLNLAVLYVFAILVPDIDSAGDSVLERLFGYFPPTYLVIATIMGVASFLLGLVYIFSQHKSHFRSTIW